MPGSGVRVALGAVASLVLIVALLVINFRALTGPVEVAFHSQPNPVTD